MRQSEVFLQRARKPALERGPINRIRRDFGGKDQQTAPKSLVAGLDGRPQRRLECEPQIPIFDQLIKLLSCASVLGLEWL